MYALVDCNNFYASCERVFKPSLNKQPIIVLSNNDGCVIARSNEAKILGIKMGEPAFKIKQTIKKNNINVFSTNFALYGDFSKRVMNILSDIIPNIEVYSIDEAFLDLQGFKCINNLCLSIRYKIYKCTGIPVSIGVGQTKTLAKIANHIAKKNQKYKGVFILEKNKEDNILDFFPIENIWGIGSKLSFFLKTKNILTAGLLKNRNLKWARYKSNINLEKIIKELRGEKCFIINSNFSNKKSICTSRTFGEMVTNYDDLSASIAMYVTRCAEKLRLQKTCAHYACIFIQTNLYRSDLNQYIKSSVINFDVATNDTSEILHYVLKVLKRIYKDGYKYKKAGVIVGGIVNENEVQTNLFDVSKRYKNQKILSVVDILNAKMGQDIIKYAALGNKKKWQLKQQSLSQCYTTRWSDLLKINLK
tara:strand:- start:670 stop:1926 length:1257 start_codon:yes stop_codon:yes gene_type:complete